MQEKMIDSNYVLSSEENGGEATRNVREVMPIKVACAEMDENISTQKEIKQERLNVMDNSEKDITASMKALKEVLDKYNKNNLPGKMNKWKLRKADPEVIYWCLKSKGELKAEYAREWFGARKSRYKLLQLANAWKENEIEIFEDVGHSDDISTESMKQTDPYSDFISALGKCFESSSGIEGSSQLVMQLMKLNNAEMNTLDKKLDQLPRRIEKFQEILKVMKIFSEDIP